ncbi:uncharacterized protein LOC142930476 [Petromyzon marinus]|uniref:uncharacterized protein LOC142930476 n=1 Tax=Petromyzon marinus TaxID=7757 RepID=UPI003F72D130
MAAGMWLAMAVVGLLATGRPPCLVDAQNMTTVSLQESATSHLGPTTESHEDGHSMVILIACLSLLLAVFTFSFMCLKLRQGLHVAPCSRVALFTDTAYSPVATQGDAKPTASGRGFRNLP